VKLKNAFWWAVVDRKTILAVYDRRRAAIDSCYGTPWAVARVKLTPVGKVKETR